MSLGAARAASVVRIATGVIFIAEGYSKASGKFVRGGFAERAGEIAAKAWPVWAGFLRDAVVPNAATVAWLIAAGELAVGIGLVLGLWTRAACAGGALLVLAFLLGQFYAPAGSWADWIVAGLTSKFALLLLALLGLVDAGKTWGLDGRVRRGRRRLST
jgi:thiosulfate dehydrogenase [quinone] large subunit